LVSGIVYVALAAPLKGVQQVPADLNKPTIQRPRAVPSQRPADAGFKPVSFTTGTRPSPFQPVSFTTVPLGMTGTRPSSTPFQPVSFTTVPLGMTGNRP
jgi:hypothetical protein